MDFANFHIPKTNPPLDDSYIPPPRYTILPAAPSLFLLRDIPPPSLCDC